MSANTTKALSFFVTILKGRIIHQGFTNVLQTESTCIALGDGVYEIARPTQVGSFAAEGVNFSAPFDT